MQALAVAAAEQVEVDVADRLLVRRAGRKAKHIFGRNTQFGRDRTFRGCAIDRHSHFPAARAQQQIKKRKRDCSEHRNRFFRTVCRPCGRQTVGKKGFSGSQIDLLRYRRLPVGNRDRKAHLRAYQTRDRSFDAIVAVTHDRSACLARDRYRIDDFRTVGGRRGAAVGVVARRDLQLYTVALGKSAVFEDVEQVVVSARCGGGGLRMGVAHRAGRRSCGGDDRRLTRRFRELDARDGDRSRIFLREGRIDRGLHGELGHRTAERHRNVGRRTLGDGFARRGRHHEAARTLGLGRDLREGAVIVRSGGFDLREQGRFGRNTRERKVRNGVEVARRTRCRMRQREGRRLVGEFLGGERTLRNKVALGVENVNRQRREALLPRFGGGSRVQGCTRGRGIGKGEAHGSTVQRLTVRTVSHGLLLRAGDQCKGGQSRDKCFFHNGIKD